MRWRWVERKFPKNTVRFNIRLLQIDLPYDKQNKPLTSLASLSIWQMNG